MQNVQDVFSEVYSISLSKAHSLFVALDHENVGAIILDGNTYWTEQNTYSKGLTKMQQKQLAKIMHDNFDATYLYATNNTIRSN